MDYELPGIHHITAIAGDPQANVDFYAGILGLRLVKLTINFDDPGTYHLYYGDGVGHPGTIMTFFPWPKSPRGRIGAGQVSATAFAVPAGSLPYWTERLQERGVVHKGPVERFDEQALLLADPDGLGVELIESAIVPPDRAWQDGPVPVEYAVHGFHSATLTVEGYQRTATLLTETMQFRLIGEQGPRFRYATPAGGPGAIADVVCAPEEHPGRIGVGTVHHIAWRAPNDEQQASWRAELARLHYNVTPVIDRKYFHSIYFREPGGILFEIATDPPGFGVDEPLDQLGSKLQLPPWLEPAREHVMSVLPPIQLPERVKA
jgi:glyoxalase family protein